VLHIVALLSVTSRVDVAGSLCFSGYFCDERCMLFWSIEASSKLFHPFWQYGYFSFVRK
jgi:hypothetical protein